MSLDENKKYSDETLATHLGRDPLANEGAVNPPIQKTSTILFENYAEFKEISEGRSSKIHYGRHGMQLSRGLEEALAKLEGADKCLITSSGVSAITTVLLALLEPGDELLMVDSAYSPTRDFCDQELKRYNITTKYYDPLIGENIADLITENTKVVFVESPGSLTFEVQDIPAISKVAHEKGALVVMDNTWATPLYFKSFSHGVDVSIHSATKYICGHSDVLMGIINCTKATYGKIKRVYKNLGICPGPEDVYLAQRGLRTLSTRLKAHSEAALDIAKWLKTSDKISKVFHPALPENPGHEFWKRDFLGCSGVFTFVLKRHLNEEELAKFFDGLDLFKIGYSWGGYESLALTFDTKKIRTATDWDVEGTAIRLSIGFESVDDLKSDLEAGLNRI